MEEKQQLLEAEAAQMAGTPPAYTAVKVPLSTIESLSTTPQLPAWIRRLPFTLPLAHFMLTVPLSLMFSRSLAGAVFFCSAVSFWLLVTATIGTAKATRHDIRLRRAGGRYLFGAGALMIVWPLLAVLFLGPSHLARCSRMHHGHGLHNKHHSHQHHERPFHLHQSAPIASPATAVTSPKGDRVLVAAVGQKLADIQAMFPKLNAERIRVTVEEAETKGEAVKNLFAEDLERLKAAAPKIYQKLQEQQDKKQ